MSKARKAYQKAYYERNKARLLEKQRARNAASYKANKAKYAEKSKRWREANPERYRELTKAYAQANREKVKATSRAWYAANKDRARATSRRLKLKGYGLTVEQFGEMLALQQGACLICLQQMLIPVVDHDHVTGRVRGLLCRKCNSALGLLQDSPTVLRRAVRYLTRSSSGATSTPSRKRSNKPSPSED
jgi:hypothetical protein